MTYYRPSITDVRHAYLTNDSLLVQRPWDESERDVQIRLGKQFDEAIRQVQADAFAEGVNRQWKHRPLGNRSPYNPYL